MKKIVLIIGLVFSTFFAFSQSLVVTGGDYFTSDALIDISHHLDLKNISSFPITVVCKKTIISSPNGLPSWAGASYCFAGNCYSTSATGPSSTAVIASGQTFSYDNNDLEAFSGYYTPGSIEGTTVVEYCFSDQNNPGDKSCVTITYVISNATAINELTKISEFYPNPSKGIINFDYELNTSATLLIIDMLGHEIKSIELENQGNKRINISNLSKGIYFGKVIANNKLVDIKKIVIE